MSTAFSDLQTRLLSAAVMIAVGASALWVGGWVFAALAVVIAGLMAWELYRMVVPEAPPGRAEAHAVVVAVLVAVFSLSWHGWISVAALVLAAVLLSARVPRHRKMFGAYLALILLAGHGLIELREGPGLAWVLWLLGVVIASDVAGYFAGRLIGGAKFWPRLSPKKTWSGTVAGWVLAALVGAAFVPVLDTGWGLVPLSAALAFAGQMGDIAESAIKRREGVKDSSSLIPGHGGVMDRFDALVAVVVLDLVLVRTGILDWAVG
jgi:phosphatidate cytidylyltransferase